MKAEDGLDYSEFNIYQQNEDHFVYNREWFSKVLLMSKEPVEGVDENEFFSAEDV